jgi:hypothetical protein
VNWKIAKENEQGEWDYTQRKLSDGFA